MRRKYSFYLTRIIIIVLLLTGAGLNTILAQSIPALSFDLKKPQKLENKKLGSERGADKKFTKLRRFTQNTFTKYNWHFNANEKLKEIVDRAKNSHKDDYTKLLSFYNYSPGETVRDSVELDSVIYKANAGILLHDLRSDWVDNLYMLMGKAYYLRQTFDTAYLTFQYINYAFAPKEKDGYDKPIGSNANEGGSAFSISTKEKTNFVKKLHVGLPSRNESFLWQIRTYLAIDEFPEAAGLIEILKADPQFPERLKPSLAEMQSLWFYQQQRYDSAAFYLEKALDNATNREEQARWEYLIAQLYELSGKPEQAQDYYEQSIKHTLNPILEVYARLNSIRQNKGDEKAIQLNIDELLKMARKDRYTNYRDIIYYSAAQMELERNNRAAAKALLLRSTTAAIDKSADPNQKSRSFLMLGDLSYQEADYSNAKRFYDSVLNPEVVSNPDEFLKRKGVLTTIASNTEVIYRQDSLQRVAAMPEDEREQYIRKLVKKLRKSQGLKEDEPVASANNPLNPNTAPTDLFDNNAKGEWYFYNPSLKSKGFSEFRGKWGSRPNVDNWRRMSAVQQAVQKKQEETDKLKAGQSSTADDGMISYEALLKKLPLTPEQMTASNDSIEMAQLAVGKALMEGLEDYSAAIETLEKFCERFTYSSRRPQALAYLYYCYKKTGNNAKAEAIRQELQQRYAGTTEEKTISNPKAASAPDPQKEAMTAQYNKIYNLFIEGKFDEALAEKRIGDSLYSKNYWTPQLLYIQSIYFIKQKMDDSAKSTLQNIVNIYATTVLAEKAKNMIEVLNRRKEIEEYLTKLKIERPTDSTITIPTDLPNDRKPVLVRNDSNLIVSPKPPVITEKVPPPVLAKDSAQKKPPVAPGKPMYSYDPAAPQYVVIFMDRVDGVFVNEAKNAFNRYNKITFYNKQIDITSEILSDSSRIVLLNSFANADEALTYIEKVKKVASTEIVPWLPVAKYSFGIISAPNLETLKTSKDMMDYRRYLKQALPGKFD